MTFPSRPTGGFYETGDVQDYSEAAKHLRGRVFRQEMQRQPGRYRWYVEVINTAQRNRVISSDGPFLSHVTAFRDVEARVHAARGAWKFDYTAKKVKR